MTGIALKNNLLQIAQQVDQHTTLEDVYKLLAMLEDVEASEAQVERGEVIPHEEVMKQSEQWLK